MMRVVVVTATLVALTTPVRAQVTHGAPDSPDPIRALSDADVEGLLDGAGMGFAKAAELNGVPGPRHVLDLATELHLNEGQRRSVASVFERMHERAVDLGARVVEGERRLDAMFASGEAVAEEVARHTVELGRLLGELRAVHLLAHLETAALLSPRQVERYNELRGNMPTAAEDHDGGRHRH